MILEALVNLYNTLESDEDSDVAPPNYSVAKVSYAVVLSNDGEIVDVEDLRVPNTKGKALISRGVVVPEQIKRASGVNPNFLCDNAAYCFGIDIKGNADKALIYNEAFMEHNSNILEDVSSTSAKIIKLFIEKWRVSPNQSIIIDKCTDIEKANFVFKCDGQIGYIHNDQSIKTAWENYKKQNESSEHAQCLVTGEYTPIARLHTSIKGVIGAQGSGASIISFNNDSFTSYGKKQSYNAPVGEKSTFAYTTALNYLLNSSTNRKHRSRIGDASVVFWAEKSSEGLEEELFSLLFDGSTEELEESKVIDKSRVSLLKSVLDKIGKGESVRDIDLDTDYDSKFYVLGISPNSGRLSIRFWLADTFGGMCDKLAQHQWDMKIKSNFSKDFVSQVDILREVTARGDLSRVSPWLAGNLASSILSGRPYGDSLFTAIITRIRADSIVNHVRAGIIKACLLRKARCYGNKTKEEMITMGLNTENDNIGYLLGRLFAVLENTQEGFNKNINATIKDKYFSSAANTPLMVFPTLIKLSQYHISNSDYGRSRDKEIQDILVSIDKFPSHMKLEDQGQFILGYYHQKEVRYAKTIKEEN